MQKIISHVYKDVMMEHSTLYDNLKISVENAELGMVGRTSTEEAEPGRLL